MNAPEGLLDASTPGGERRLKAKYAQWAQGGMT
jgi:hypothetical protein